MNGPEHYAEAERLLALADESPSETWATSTGEHKADSIATAQVHATLAQAAAVIDAANKWEGQAANSIAWREVQP